MITETEHTEFPKGLLLFFECVQENLLNMNVLPQYTHILQIPVFRFTVLYN